MLDRRLQIRLEREKGQGWNKVWIEGKMDGMTDGRKGGQKMG